MRTTLTLDKDVAVALEQLRKARKASLKKIVNAALRQAERRRIRNRTVAPPLRK